MKDGEFAELVQNSPRPHEAASARFVRVTGVVLRSDNPHMFHLALPGGKTVELPIAAVKEHDIVDHIGNQHLVKMTLSTNELSDSANATLMPTLGITPTLLSQRAGISFADPIGTTRVEGDLPNAGS